MNCPHGVAVGPGVSCGACTLDQEAKTKRGAIYVVQTLLRCSHGRRERVEGGAQWCGDCGAYFPRRGPVSIRHTSTVTLAILLDDTGALRGASEQEPANDSGEKIVTPAKTDT